MLFLTDNFSFSWLENKTDSTIKTKVIEAPEAQRIMNGNDWHVSFVSGQMKMAISTELGFKLEEDVTVNLRPGDKLIVSSFSEFDTYKDHAISMFSENFPDEMKSSFLLLEVS
jgi:Na+-transporting NADH:ubiquinone oxidoreductase subunit NqrF